MIQFPFPLGFLIILKFGGKIREMKGLFVGVATVGVHCP